MKRLRDQLTEELRFDGRVAIVTGAGRGIGRQHALLLASKGAAVVVNDFGVQMDGSAPDAGPAHEVVAEIRAAGGRAVASTHSVADPAGAAAIVASALDSFGRLDVVVNNAGVHVVQRVQDVTPEMFQLHLDVHVKGTLLVTKAAWPHLSGGGRVVNTTSTGMLGLPGYSAYGAAKAGVVGLTRTLALEGRSCGIAVNAIAPAAVTRMLIDAGDHLPLTSDERSLINRNSPDPSFSAAVVAALAHESCPCTGEVFSAGRGKVKRLVFAETPGIEVSDATAEVIAGQWARILDDTVLTTLPDQFTTIERGLGRTLGHG